MRYGAAPPLSNLPSTFLLFYFFFPSVRGQKKNKRKKRKKATSPCDISRELDGTIFADVTPANPFNLPIQPGVRPIPTPLPPTPPQFAHQHSPGSQPQGAGRQQLKRSSPTPPPPESLHASPSESWEDYLARHRSSLAASR